MSVCIPAISVPAITVPTVCVPSIVYSNSLTGQTAAIPLNVVFTASSEGLYRFSLGAIVFASPSGAGGLTANLSNSQNGTSISVSAANGHNGESGSGQTGCMQSGEEISFAVFPSGAFDHYEVFAVIEQLA